MEKDCLTLLLVIIIIILGMLIFNVCKSTFGGSGSKNQTSDISGISKDSVLIFYAPWCGHCKSKMKDFQEAVKSGNGKVVMIDATKDENTPLREKYEIKGFPTIIRGDGEKYNGDRSADDILNFLEN
jgi:thiol-disulfide isomerase/thioredoxin